MSQNCVRPELFFELGEAAELTLRALGLEGDGPYKEGRDGVANETEPSRTH